MGVWGKNGGSEKRVKKWSKTAFCGKGVISLGEEILFIGRLGLIQVSPHSCTPNCKEAIIETIHGLELHVIEALVDKPVGG